MIRLIVFLARFVLVIVVSLALLFSFIGALIGRVASFFVIGDYSEKIRIFGYHPRDPSAASVAIAASTAAAMRLPQVETVALNPILRPPLNELFVCLLFLVCLGICMFFCPEDPQLCLFF